MEKIKGDPTNPITHPDTKKPLKINPKPIIIKPMLDIENAIKQINNANDTLTDDIMQDNSDIQAQIVKDAPPLPPEFLDDNYKKITEMVRGAGVPELANAGSRTPEEKNISKLAYTPPQKKKPYTIEEAEKLALEKSKQVTTDEVIKFVEENIKPNPKPKPWQKNLTKELTDAERTEIYIRLENERIAAEVIKRAEIKKKRQAHAYKAIAAKKAKREERLKKEKEDAKQMKVIEKKVKKGRIDKAGLPAIKPLSWLKTFRSEYEVSAGDLRRICMAFIFGHSIDELKLMTSKEHSHEIPVIVYYFAKSFIEEAEKGEVDAMEKLLDRIFGKSIQKEMTVNATLDLTPKKDVDEEDRRAELDRLEREVSMLMNEGGM